VDCSVNMVSEQGSNSVASCLCDQGYTGDDCTACGNNTYKTDTGPGLCTQCTAHSVSPPQSKLESDCVCIAAEGWSPSNDAGAVECERRVQTTLKFFEIPTPLNEFNVLEFRNDFKTALADAFAVNTDNITMLYYAAGTTKPSYAGRRRRVLLQETTGEATIIEATIRSFASIPLPSDAAVRELMKEDYDIIQHKNASTVPSENGFLLNLSLPWFIAVVVVSCLCFCVFAVLMYACCFGNSSAEEEFNSETESEDALFTQHGDQSMYG